MFIGTLWPINDEYKQEIEVLWTAKIRFWDPTICSTSGFEDLQNHSVRVAFPCKMTKTYNCLDTLAHWPEKASDSRYTSDVGIDNRLSVQSNQLNMNKSCKANK
jgi:hypothetical protein